MAVVWLKHHDGVRYEVRTAGQSVRLYTDGVFHSQWNPLRPLGGNLWDLLFLPALLHPNHTNLNRVLVLGVGGGAVINALNYYLSPKKVIGVDLDKTHLYIADKYFGVTCKNTSLVCTNAVAYIEQANGKELPKEDIIIEDLFSGAKDDPSCATRSVEVNDKWMTLLSERLGRDGILVINFENLKQLTSTLGKRSLGGITLKESALDETSFQHIYALTLPRYENAVAVCLKYEHGELKESLKNRLKEALLSVCGAAGKQQNYSMRRIR
ncbi:MAG: hypothetical protein ACI9Y1_000723 [Lentisphaeria bacterium]